MKSIIFHTLFSYNLSERNSYISAESNKLEKKLSSTYSRLYSLSYEGSDITYKNPPMSMRFFVRCIRKRRKDPKSFDSSRKSINRGFTAKG